MKELQVGEYVRINNNFRVIALGIGKVIRINQDTIYIKMNLDLPIALKIENITKHSANITDLIEVGDYVNGRLVLAVDYKRQNICLLIPLTDTKANTNIMWYGYEEIKTILTHELYESNAYKAKGE